MLKATALGYKFVEIPAILEWKKYKHEGKRVVRKSASKVNHLIVTHTLFSIFANPMRYAWFGSIVSLLAGTVFSVWSVILYLQHEISAYSALLGVLLIVLGIVLFMMGVVLQQGNMLQREMWALQQAQKAGRFNPSHPREYRFDHNDRAQAPSTDP
jgi:hypothetical protein